MIFGNVAPRYRYLGIYLHKNRNTAAYKKPSGQLNIKVQSKRTCGPGWPNGHGRRPNYAQAMRKLCANYARNSLPQPSPRPRPKPSLEANWAAPVWMPFKTNLSLGVHTYNTGPHGSALLDDGAAIRLHEQATETLRLRLFGLHPYGCLLRQILPWGYTYGPT